MFLSYVRRQVKKDPFFPFIFFDQAKVGREGGSGNDLREGGGKRWKQLPYQTQKVCVETKFISNEEMWQRNAKVDFFFLRNILKCLVGKKYESRGEWHWREVSRGGGEKREKYIQQKKFQCWKCVPVSKAIVQSTGTQHWWENKRKHEKVKNCLPISTVEALPDNL